MGSNLNKLKAHLPEDHRPFAALRAKDPDKSTIRLEVDPGNPEAAAYAAKFNDYLSALERGEDVKPNLPPANFDPKVLHVVWRDENGIPHPDRVVQSWGEKLQDHIRNGEDVGKTMSENYQRFKDAYAQAMKTAPSDHAVSKLGDKGYLITTTPTGSFYVNKDNAEAVAWANEIRKHLKADGTVDPQDVPEQKFSNSEIERRPLPGASPAEKKETNAFNTMLHEGIGKLAAQYRASSAPAAHAPAFATPS